MAAIDRWDGPTRPMFLLAAGVIYYFVAMMFIGAAILPSPGVSTSATLAAYAVATAIWVAPFWVYARYDI